MKLISASALLVASVTMLNQQDQQRLQARQLQEHQMGRAMKRAQTEVSLHTDLLSASLQESALKSQLEDMEAGETLRRDVDPVEHMKRFQAFRRLQYLKAERLRLEKKVDCDRIQVTLDQLRIMRDSDQAFLIQSLWNVPCPQLLASR